MCPEQDGITVCPFVVTLLPVEDVEACVYVTHSTLALLFVGVPDVDDLLAGALGTQLVVITIFRPGSVLVQAVVAESTSGRVNSLAE